MSVTNKPMMRDPRLYESSKNPTRRDASEMLAEYSARMRLRERAEARALDVGCGDGGLTVEVLLPHLPARAQLDALDIGPEMVEHARAQHAGTRVRFLLADVAADVPEDMLGRYDYVFSFFTLHWVPQQREALANVASMLAPDGECLLVFIARCAIFDVFRLMATQPAWAELMAGVEQLMPPYLDCAQPDGLCRRLLLANGFRSADVTARLKEYDFEGIDVFKKFIRAVNPVAHRLDSEQLERFHDDYVDVIRDKGLMQITTDDKKGNVVINCKYTLIVAHAAK